MTKEIPALFFYLLKEEIKSGKIKKYTYDKSKLLNFLSQKAKREGISKFGQSLFSPFFLYRYLTLEFEI